MALKLVLIGIPGKLGKLVLIHQIQLALSLPLLLALYLAFEELLALNFILIRAGSRSRSTGSVSLDLAITSKKSGLNIRTA